MAVSIFLTNPYIMGETQQTPLGLQVSTRCSMTAIRSLGSRVPWELGKHTEIVRRRNFMCKVLYQFRSPISEVLILHPLRNENSLHANLQFCLFQQSPKQPSSNASEVLKRKAVIYLNTTTWKLWPRLFPLQTATPWCLVINSGQRCYNQISLGTFNSPSFGIFPVSIRRTASQSPQQSHRPEEHT